MLRIAVPNKGSLAEASAEMLREAGYRVRRDSKELVLVDPENEVEFSGPSRHRVGRSALFVGDCRR